MIAVRVAPLITKPQFVSRAAGRITGAKFVVSGIPISILNAYAPAKVPSDRFLISHQLFVRRDHDDSVAIAPLITKTPASL